MHQRRSVKFVVIGAIVPLVLVAGAAPAFAESKTETSDQAYLIVDLAEAQVFGDSVFYPTGEISADTVVIIPDADGSLPGGMTEADLEFFVEAAQSGDSSRYDMEPLGQGAFTLPDAPDPIYQAMSTGPSRSYVANSINWSAPYVGQSIIGTTDGTRVTYSFNAQVGTSQRNVGEGRGFYQGYNGSQFGFWARWYGLGSATANSTAYVSVPWGQVIATAQFRAKCSTSTACAGRWGP